MTRAITYTLWLEEPCLLAAPGGDPNTESSLDYIPGGAMRGALAAAYLRGGGDEDQFVTLFLSGGARFLNAYPYLDGRTLPPPRAWATKKENETTVYNRLVDTARDEVEEGLPQGFKAPFIRPPAGAEDNTVLSPKVEHEIAVHTARNRQKGRAIDADPQGQSALFRYRALARDQQFAGAIVLDDALPAAGVTRLEELLKGATLLLGGSQMAGYGLTQVEDVTPHEPWREEAGLPPAVAAGESFILYLTAPAILYNPRTGQPTSDIRLFLPGDPANCEENYTIRDSYTAAGWVGGFNKHRGLPLPQQWAVQMGSTWRITTHRALSTDALAELEDSGIGVRREEGFGRLLFVPQWPATLARAEDALSIQVKRPAAAAAASPEDARLLARMNERLARRELDRRLTLAVNDKARPDKIRGHLSRSQFGRLMVRIRQEPRAGDFAGFTNYLEGTKKRKSADDQFRKYTVGGDNFRDYLSGLAREPECVWQEIGAEAVQPTQIGPSGDDYQAGLAHEYTIRFISDLCRQLSKREVEP